MIVFGLAVTGESLTYPPWISTSAQNMCDRLLEADPKERLGSKGGAKEVKEHPWLKDTDWVRKLSWGDIHDGFVGEVIPEADQATD